MLQQISHLIQTRFVFFHIFICLSPFFLANQALLAHPKSSVSKTFIHLQIDKKTQKAHILDLPDPALQHSANTLRSFTIALGKVMGDKFKEGDNKTPEGIYFARPHIPSTQLLNSKYGPHAIPLNFPNPIDKLHHKTGHGIWLHGAGDDRRIQDIFVTEGCVAFYNKDILDVRQYIIPYQTLITISQDATHVNHPQEIAAVHARTQNWLQAWETRHLENYMSFYHKDFRGKGRNWQAYRSYKKRIFNSYKKITLKNSNIRVITHQKYAISIMNQDFYGDRHFVSKGRKVLYWLKADGMWQIIKESFNNRRFQPLNLGSLTEP